MGIQRWEDDGGFVPNLYDLVGVSKRERFQEFLRLLNAAPPVSSYNEAKQLVDAALNSVEDRTGIPYNPDNWQTDGRLYPVFADRISQHQDDANVMELVSVGHITYIGSNGAIEIILKDKGIVVFQKTGANGLGVWQ